MGDDSLVAKVDAQRHPTGAVVCTLLAEFDELLSVEFRRLQLAKPCSQELQTGGLRSAVGLSDLRAIALVKIDRARATAG